MKKMFRLSAFTLAETLLTLVIIGVVAAMTLPTLKNHADEQKFVAYTQKAFADVSDATARLETKYGDVRFWDLSDINTVKNYYSTVLETVPFTAKSWSSSSINGQSNGNITYHFRTNNGFTWSISKVAYNSQAANTVQVTIDVNGNLEPNVLGLDIHSFYILNDKIQPKSACTSYVIKTAKMPWVNKAMSSCPN